MSWDSWTEQGFGYPLFDKKDNTESIISFILEHDKTGIYGTPEEIHAFMEEDECVWWEEYFGCPISAVVASIINSLEGLSIIKGYAPCGNTDQEEMLGIEPVFPWSGGLTRKDRMLTEEKATGILKKYAKLLGITSSPGYFYAEYAG